MGRAAMLGMAGTTGAAVDISVDVSCTEATCAEMEMQNEHTFDCKLQQGRCVCQDEFDGEFRGGCLDYGGWRRLK